MKIKECMCKNIVVAYPNTTIENCCKIMEKNHIGCVPVCDQENKIIGIITDRDIVLRGIACQKDPKTTQLSDIMTTEVFCCQSNDEIEEAENKMKENHIRRLPVMEGDKIIGMLTLGDLATQDKIDCECVGKTFEEICCQSSKQNAE